ncbi:MAG: DUF6231 family protein, partial [Arenicellales bacterium WSBS_2016_MAG_OTU3]
MLTLETNALELIRSLNPTNILVVGNVPGIFSASDLEQRIRSIWINTEEDVELLALNDIVLVTQTLDERNHDLMRLLIASLRDRIAKRFLLFAHTASHNKTHWNQNELIALGLSRMGQSPHTSDKTALFHYNINDYKQTPDWLNAKYWANPEQFSNDIPEAMQTALQKPEQAPKKLETLGDHIKNKRLIKSQSIEQAAVELNIGPITLWRWEANHYEPQPE